MLVPARGITAMMSTSTRFTIGRSEYFRVDVGVGEKGLTRLRYHDENTKLEDLTHPEDIEHFKKHEEMELEQERLEKLSKQSIVLENIPAKFRRD
jgi:hypothetical protein